MTNQRRRANILRLGGVVHLQSGGPVAVPRSDTGGTEWAGGRVKPILSYRQRVGLVRSLFCLAARGTKAAREGLGDRYYVPGGRGPSNWIPHFFAFEACSTATIWPFIWASSAAVCLSPPTKKAAGQKITTAAAVANPSFVRCLSWAPDNVAALVDMA